MNRKLLIILAAIAFILQACSTTHKIYIRAIASKGQKLIDVNGVPSIISQKNHLVSLGLYKYRLLTDYSEDYSNQYWYGGDRDLEYLAAFSLIVKNLGDAPITISSDGVSITFIGKNRTQQLPVISARSLRNKIESAEQSARNSVKAFSTQITNVTGAAKFGRQDAERRLEKIRKDQKLVEELVLEPQTVFPGDSVMGLIVCDTQGVIGKKEGIFHIVLPVGGEEHNFYFNYSQTADFGSIKNSI